MVRGERNEIQTEKITKKKLKKEKEGKLGRGRKEWKKQKRRKT